MATPRFASGGALSRLGIALSLVFAAACSDGGNPTAPGGAPSLAQGGAQGPDLRAAIAAQARYEQPIMARSGVEGIGVGLTDTGRPAVVIMTANGAVGGLPRRLDGVPVTLMVTGPFSAILPRAGRPAGAGNPRRGVDPTARFDLPVPLGVSIGNEGECSAGTLGARVSRGGNHYILSNNHVLAMENTAPIGSRILQPGRYDTSPKCSSGGTSAIGTLAQFVPVQFDGGDNVVDAALASTNAGQVADSTFPGGYGRPNHLTANATLGMAVQKCGRTTSCTHGSVAVVNATVSVQYSTGVATFKQQVVITGSRGQFSRSGDSGSLIVTDDASAHPVALLFAGGQTATIGNPIDAVLSALNVTIDGK